MTALLDSFGRRHTYLRISVTDRCNLRCIYCMPPEGFRFRMKKDLLTDDEIVRLAGLCAELGVTKIRLTGGEPLVRPGLPGLVGRIARIRGIDTIGLTSNGVLLKDHVQDLRRARLTHLNVSLDTLREERFARIALRSHFHDVLSGIEEALAAGFTPLKVNVVVMGGFNDDELTDFVEWAGGRPVNLRFIEYMPFRWNSWNSATFVSYADMLAMLRTRYVLTPSEEESTPHAVAKEYRVEGMEGTVGFITSMSEHFCDGCNRIRLTADGSIKSCLFHPAEVNLRDAMRSGAGDEELVTLIRHALILKPAGHAPAEELVEAENRSMIEIGG